MMVMGEGAWLTSENNSMNRLHVILYLKDQSDMMLISLRPLQNYFSCVLMPEDYSPGDAG